MSKEKQTLTAEEKAKIASENIDAVVDTKKDNVDPDADDADEDEELEEEVVNPFLTKIDETSPVDVSEISTIFEGQAVAEDFKNKFTTLFQAIVTKTVNEALEKKNADAAKVWLERCAQYDEGTLSLVSDFLDLHMEDWKTENKIAIDPSLKSNLLDDLMEEVRGVFTKFNITLPADKVDMVAAAQKEAADMKADVNKLTEANLELSKKLLAMEKEKAFESMTEGLAATEVEKLRTLAEGVDAKDIEAYKKNVGILKESAFPKKEETQDKEADKPLTEEMDPVVANYLKFMRPSNS